MIRDLFVPLLDAPGDDDALDAALALAQAFGAHVTAFVTLEHPVPLAAEVSHAAFEIDALQLNQARQRAEAQQQRAEARLARESIASEVRVSGLMPLWSEESAAWQARHADLSVIGGSDERTDSRFGLSFRSLLARSGRPVLYVPRGARVRAPSQRPVIAWTPTADASRALHDALPLFAPGAEVDVLMIDPVVSERAHGEQPGAEIARHLARYGFEVRVISRTSEGWSVGECLLRHVLEAGSDLLVMGGYGHGHWREFLLGGATRSVLAGAKTPVLFSR
jgi:nucleotide-binding universal stress UspA family protein